MWFWLQTILFPLSLTCSSRLLSHDKKKTHQDFQSELSYPLKPKSIQCCPKEESDVVLVSWLTWKENRGSSLSLALLASLAQYGWTSNDWLGVICVTIEATWVLFYVLCWRLLHCGWVLKKSDMLQIQPLDGGATPDSKWDWLEVERNYWNILEVWGYLKPHNHNLKQVCFIPVLTNITNLYTTSYTRLLIHLHIHIYLPHCQCLSVKAQVCSEWNKERGQSQGHPI